jgi:dynein heavy chain, axonemal
MKQEVTRAHVSQKWALNDVTYYSEVTEFEKMEQLRAPPKEGVYVHGISVDGARWDKNNSTLAESEPKRLFSPLPVLYVTAINKQDPRATPGAGFFAAPCYRYPLRCDRYLIFPVWLPTKTKKATHWVMRGVALLSTTA